MWHLCMPRKLTTEEFIRKANAVHDMFYVYDLVDYRNNSTKIKIICPHHGVFIQTPRDHLCGNGCMQCSLDKKSLEQRMPVDVFLERLRVVHGDTYDYSLVEYKNSYSKIKIICEKHGLFEQTAHLHLSGSGCPNCGFESRAKTHLYSTDQFVELAKKMHEGKGYDYCDVEYIDSRTSVKIICEKHGDFYQIPYYHLSGSGCPECGAYNAGRSNSLSNEEFASKASVVHKNKYDYSESEYFSRRVAVKIICPKHGAFYQVPEDHFRGCGCPKCSISISNVETRWLDMLGIPNDSEHRQVRIKIGKSRYSVDGFDPDKNIVYEFYGDLWHGNPNIYRPDDFCMATKKTFGEMFSRTMEKEESLRRRDIV